MAGQLAAYEARLRERAQLSAAEMMSLDDDDFVSLKFTREGQIKPLYGLTCITWIAADSPLFKQLYEVKSEIQTTLETAGVEDFFAFLAPSSYHMTVCDICASTAPLTSSAVQTVRRQVDTAFTTPPVTGPITARVYGIGLNSTITALVHFRDEAELHKVLQLEKQVKQATGANKRDFLGHITLAYGLKSPKNHIEHIREVLHPYREHSFGELTFSAFDLTCFTDMNNFIPLNTVDFANGQIARHPNVDQCQCKAPAATEK